MYILNTYNRANPSVEALKTAGAFETLYELVQWNNAPERTQEEIHALCVKAGV